MVSLVSRLPARLSAPRAAAMMSVAARRGLSAAAAAPAHVAPAHEMEEEVSPSMSAPMHAAYQKDGFLLIKNFFSAEETESIKRITQEITDLPEMPGKWMKYFETIDGEKKLCRIENVTPYHKGFREMLNTRLANVLTEVTGEKYNLFKEKINYKLPGAKGFTPHQDAPAYTEFGCDSHMDMVSVMVPIDRMVPENGCLEATAGHHTEGLLEHPGGAMKAEDVERMEWKHITAEPGDIMLFHALTPHRSGDNVSGMSRRAWYMTYNLEKDGDMYADYFKDKRAKFPPPIERVEGVDYGKIGAKYNLSNPID